MAIKKMILFCGRYSFELLADDRFLPEWRQAGIEIYVVENTIPEIVAQLGLAKVWCAMQDILGFRWVKK